MCWMMMVVVASKHNTPTAAGDEEDPGSSSSSQWSGMHPSYTVGTHKYVAGNAQKWWCCWQSGDTDNNNYNRIRGRVGVWNGDSTSCRLDTRSSKFVREKFVHVEREDNDSCTSTILSLAILIKAFGSIPADLVWLSHPHQHTPPILLLLRSSVPVRSFC